MKTSHHATNSKRFCCEYPSAKEPATRNEEQLPKSPQSKAKDIFQKPFTTNQTYMTWRSFPKNLTDMLRRAILRWVWRTWCNNRSRDQCQEQQRGRASSIYKQRASRIAPQGSENGGYLLSHNAQYHRRCWAWCSALRAPLRCPLTLCSAALPASVASAAAIAHCLHCSLPAACCAGRTLRVAHHPRAHRLYLGSISLIPFRRTLPMIPFIEPLQNTPCNHRIKHAQECAYARK